MSSKKLLIPLCVGAVGAGWSYNPSPQLDRMSFNDLLQLEQMQAAQQARMQQVLYN